MEDLMSRVRGNTRVYLDNNATTPPHKNAIDTMCETAKEAWGNPSALYVEGNLARGPLFASRKVFADMMRVDPDTVIFTSCGTESNNIAIRAVMRKAMKNGRNVLVTSAIEHPSVWKVAETIKDCVHVTILPTEDGYIKTDALREVLRKHKNRVGLVSIIMAQNEVGTIQNIHSLALATKQVLGKNVPFHTDATQAFGKYYIYPTVIGVDLMTGSAHKFHGPRGVGFLYAVKGVIEPENTVMAGGGQERGCRSGTENVAAIAGASQALLSSIGNYEEWRMLSKKTKYNRDLIIKIVVSNIRGVIIHGDPENGLYNTVCMALPGIPAYAMVELLDKEGISVGAGSACSKAKPSKTIMTLYRARKDNDIIAKCSIRVSLNPFLSTEDCEYAAKKIVSCYNILRKIQ